MLASGVTLDGVLGQLELEELIFGINQGQRTPFVSEAQFNVTLNAGVTETVNFKYQTSKDTKQVL